MRMRDRSINGILEKSLAGERLSENDALALFKSPDLMSIGKYADLLNKKHNQDKVFYNVNRHINPTNICAHTCKFCAFSRKPGEEGGYAYTTEEMVEKAAEAVSQGATEVHMVGGLHPRWSFQVYLDIIKAIKDKFPDLHLKAFTAVELAWMAKKASYGNCFQIVKTIGISTYAHLIVVRLKSQGNKDIKTCCDILQFTQSAHMINAVRKIFDVAVEHGCVGTNAHFV